MQTDNPGRDWVGITQEPDKLTDEDKRLWDEGVAAAPAGFVVGSNTIEMLPRRKVTGRCRICSTVGELTKEHIPPKESGNKQNTTDHSLKEWLANQASVEDIGKGKKRQGGIFGYTLCRSCNSITGHKYGSEYKLWAYSGYQALSQLDLTSINQQAAPAFGISIQFGRDASHPVHPGALVRQVLSMMCSLSGPWDLASTYPEIQEIILKDKQAALPNGLDLGISLFAGPRMRLCGPQLVMDLADKSWQWVMEVAFPPFAFLLILASSKPEPLEGMVMNEWPLKPPSEPIVFRGDIAVGFGWSPYPGDYRSAARIASESAASS